MQTLAAEQILFWSFVDSAVLWMAGTKQHYHFRGVPHCPILSLELWGLPEPYGSSAVDRSHVFFDILHIRQSAASKHPYGCHPGFSKTVCHGPMRRSFNCSRIIGFGLYWRGCFLLQTVFWLVQLGTAAFPSFNHIDSGADICSRKRLVLRPSPSLSGLCMDVCPLLVYCLAAA